MRPGEDEDPNEEPADVGSGEGLFGDPALLGAEEVDEEQVAGEFDDLIEESEGSWTTGDEEEEEDGGGEGGMAGRPAGRGGHAAAVVGGFLYIHGGNTVESSFSDCWRVNLTALNAAVDVALQFTPHEASPDEAFSDEASGRGSGAYVVPVPEVRWQEVRCAQVPPARIGHTMVAMGSRVIL